MFKNEIKIHLLDEEAFELCPLKKEFNDIAYLVDNKMWHELIDQIVSKIKDIKTLNNHIKLYEEFANIHKHLNLWKLPSGAVFENFVKFYCSLPDRLYSYNHIEFYDKIMNDWQQDGDLNTSLVIIDRLKLSNNLMKFIRQRMNKNEQEIKSSLPSPSLFTETDTFMNWCIKLCSFMNIQLLIVWMRSLLSHLHQEEGKDGNDLKDSCRRVQRFLISLLDSSIPLDDSVWKAVIVDLLLHQKLAIIREVIRAIFISSLSKCYFIQSFITERVFTLWITNSNQRNTMILACLMGFISPDKGILLINQDDKMEKNQKLIINETRKKTLFERFLFKIQKLLDSVLIEEIECGIVIGEAYSKICNSEIKEFSSKKSLLLEEGRFHFCYGALMDEIEPYSWASIRPMDYNFNSPKEMENIHNNQNILDGEGSFPTEQDPLPINDIPIPLFLLDAIELMESEEYLKYTKGFEQLPILWSQAGRLKKLDHVDRVLNCLLFAPVENPLLPNLKNQVNEMICSCLVDVPERTSRFLLSKFDVINGKSSLCLEQKLQILTSGMLAISNGIDEKEGKWKGKEREMEKTITDETMEKSIFSSQSCIISHFYLPLCYKIGSINNLIMSHWALREKMTLFMAYYIRMSVNFIELPRMIELFLEYFSPVIYNHDYDYENENDELEINKNISKNNDENVNILTVKTILMSFTQVLKVWPRDLSIMKHLLLFMDFKKWMIGIKSEKIIKDNAELLLNCSEELDRLMNSERILEDCVKEVKLDMNLLTINTIKDRKC